MKQNVHKVILHGIILIAKYWKQPTYPSKEGWLNTPWYSHRMKSYVAELRMRKVFLNWHGVISKARWKKRGMEDRMQFVN